MTPRLRTAVPDDAPALAALFLASRRAALPYLPDLYAADKVRLWMRDTVIAGRMTLMTVDRVGAALGFAAFGDGWLDHLYVAPSAQGQGVGSQLLAAAKAASPGGLRLHVFQRNAAARGFYERRDFRPVALRDGADNEEREPDAIYAWRPGFPPPESALNPGP